VSMPVESFSQANEAQFYVSMSRARKAMSLFTDSKVALREAVTRKSARLSPWELIAGGNGSHAQKDLIAEDGLRMPDCLTGDQGRGKARAGNEDEVLRITMISL